MSAVGISVIITILPDVILSAFHEMCLFIPCLDTCFRSTLDLQLLSLLTFFRLARWFKSTPDLEEMAYYEIMSHARKEGSYPCVGSMLGHRLRRWPNIEPTHELRYVVYLVAGLATIIFVISLPHFDNHINKPTVYYCSNVHAKICSHTVFFLEIRRSLTPSIKVIHQLHISVQISHSSLVF